MLNKNKQRQQQKYKNLILLLPSLRPKLKLSLDNLKYLKKYLFMLEYRLKWLKTKKKKSMKTRREIILSSLSKLNL